MERFTLRGSIKGVIGSLILGCITITLACTSVQQVPVNLHQDSPRKVELDLLWKYPAAGQVVASPSLGTGTLYIGDNSGSIYALNT